MDRVCVEIVDRKVIRRQVVPNVARVVARVMMARTGQERQVEQMHMAKERQSWQVASTHSIQWTLQSLLEMVTHREELSH